MKLLLTYIHLNLLYLIRNRSAAFFSILFPVLLILAFGHQVGNNPETRIATMIIFSNYAVQTSTFLSLALTLSAERNSDWSIYLKTLPAMASFQFAGIVISRIIAAAISLILVMIGAYWVLGIHPPLLLCGFILCVALIGGIPMAFLGIALGYRVNPAAARGIMVFINLGLLFASFSFPSHGVFAVIREFIPTYQWLMISFSHVLTNTSKVTPWLWLFAWTVIFYLLALWSYKAKRNLRVA